MRTRNTAPKGVCVGCDGEVRWNEQAAYEITGYERERTAGGANQIWERQRISGRIWHDRHTEDCYIQHIRGGWVQPELPA